MNRMQWKDFFREIQKNKGRFLSLLFIVALGCAFYSGIRSAEPDMTLSADSYYDDVDFCDIRLIGTLGLTDDDLEAVARTEGVRDCEGSYSTELFALCDSDEPIMSVISMGDRLNRFTVKEGRLPEAADECFVDIRYRSFTHCQLGDTITLVDEDKEAPDSLTSNTFRVVGFGTWAWYLNLTRGTASIGDGSVDAFLVLLPEVFTQDYYSSIYATVDGAKDVNSYSDLYDSIVEKVSDRLEIISDVQVRVRRDAIIADGEAELSDARSQIADARQELSDALNTLQDGEAEYADGLREYEEGLQEWEDGKKAYEEGSARLTDGKAAYEKGLADYQKGKQEFDRGLKEYENGKAQLEEGRRQLASSKKELDDGWAAYHKGLQEYEAGAVLLQEKEAELAEGEKALADGQQTLDSNQAELLAQKESLLATRSELEEKRPQVEETVASLEEQRASLASQRDALLERKAMQEQNQDFLGAALSEAALGLLEDLLSQLDDGLAQARDGLTQIDDGLAQIDAGLLQIEEGQTQINAGYQEIENNRRKLEDGRMELEAGKETLRQSEALLKTSYEELTAGSAAYEEGAAAFSANETALKEAGSVIESSRRQLQDAHAQLQDAAREISDGEAELSDARQTLADGRKELDDALITLDDARKELDDGWKEYQDAKADADEQIADAEQQIADGEKALADIPEGKWYVLNRDTIQTCVEYGMDAERIGKIADVFPIIFFLVAALVCLTTMTRMVEEERMLIGTMKALGYSKFSIIAKYLFYAASATLLGGLLGVLAGSKILPYVIMKAYGMLYTNVPYCRMPYHLAHCLVAIGLALLCTVGAAFGACYKELLATPASLMRPPAPKLGRKILLERIPFLWSRLNFSIKSTIRNLFRYKKRLIMTVLGIGGCMAILLVSYGLHDSIAAIVDNQYQRIWTYSAYCSIDEKLSPEEKAGLKEALTENPLIEDTMLARNASLDISTDQASKNAYIYVVEDCSRMAPFLDLHDRTSGEQYTLTDDGVILSEKLARTLGVGPGDEVELKISDTVRRKVIVTAAAENYLFGYIYMTPALYRQVFDEDPVFNEITVRYSKDCEEATEKALAEDMLSHEGITAVHLATGLQKSVDNMMNALNLVVWVLVIAAGLLVFVVTYNLNNINISERRRELASLKVLGFYDGEVAMYVYRENIFLTLFGILAGLFLGTWLHHYMIAILEVEMIMFGRNISTHSYICSAVLTVVFSVIVNLFMYYKLRQIDMVESLKSVE